MKIEIKITKGRKKANKKDSEEFVRIKDRKKINKMNYKKNEKIKYKTTRVNKTINKNKQKYDNIIRGNSVWRKIIN